jgi:DNA topoisomerase-1
LGKDSVPWQKTLEVNSKDTRSLYENLLFFMKGKQIGSQIFDGITSEKVNTFLRSIDPKNVPGLTAKVFRTYIATKTVKEALLNPPISVYRNSSEIEKIYVAKMANLRAAMTSNHKKGVDPKNPASKRTLEKFETSIKKKQEAIESLNSQLEAKNWRTKLQKKRLEEKLDKLNIQLKLQKETRDYNLGTTLKNYIDPRVMAAWLRYIDLDPKKVYTSTLQRKFKWIEGYSERELKEFYYPAVRENQDEGIKVVEEESSK